MKIQVLTADVVDRIAAGEVLDRPANLVKELVENSLDAAATQIDIEVEQGGRQVLVSDDGWGMDASDLAIALQRHATSKIRNSEDLFALHSFGFRGEALASIAAVSSLTLTSRPRGSDHGSDHRSHHRSHQGYRVHSEFGVIGELAPVSALEGTEIRVVDLFRNVPARLKFLKSDSAEVSQIKTTIKALALSNEAVGFSLKINGELIFHWPKAQDFQTRAQAVLGKEVLFSGRHAREGLEAEVMVASPQDAGNVNRNLWFFVQRRWVQDRSLGAAVLEAYRNLLMHGEYPTAVVRLTLPPDSVDVNVHPTKSQVKFRDGQLAFRVTHRAVREVLEKSPWLQNESFNLAFDPSQTLLKPELTPCSEPASRAEGAAQPYQFQGREFERTQYATKSFPLQQVKENLRTYAAGEGDTREFKWAALQVLAQLNQTYILAQTQDAFYMVDQHAAHERVVFERLMAEFRAGKIEVQNLLLPLVFDFTGPETDALIEHCEGIEKLGLSFERIGPESLAVQAYPTIVNEKAVGEALRRLAFEISENQGERAWEKSISEIFASMACHSVIRAGQPLSREEMAALLAEMDHHPLSSFCPHGRPVFIKRRISDIERDFGRIL